MCGPQEGRSYKEVPFWPEALRGGWRLDLMELCGTNGCCHGEEQEDAGSLWERREETVQHSLLLCSAFSLPHASLETPLILADGLLAPVAREVKILEQPHSQGGLELGF